MKKKWILKSIGLFFAILLVSILISVGFMIRHLDRFADAQLRKVLAKHNLPYHKIDYSSIHLELKGRIIILKNISIIPDSLALKDPNLKKLLFKDLMEFSCEEIRITGVNLFELLMIKTLNVDTLIMQKPVLHYVQSGLEGLREPGFKEKQGPVNKDTAHFERKYRIRWIHAGELILDNGQLSFILRSQTRPFIKNKNFTLDISDLHVDLKKMPDRNTGFDLRDMRLEIDQQEISLPGGMYSLYTGHVNLSISKAHARIDTLRLIPLYGLQEFGKIAGKQTDRFKIEAASVEAFGTDMLDSYRNSSVRFRKLQVCNLNLQAYRDKNLPFDLTRFPRLPQEYILSVKNYLKVDSLVVSQGFIDYQELRPGATQAGRVFLDSLNAVALNITNDSAVIKVKNMIKINGRFRLMGNGKANVNIFLPLNRNDGSFEFNGIMYGLDIKTLNPFLEPNALVRINSGFASRVEFKAQARNNVAQGKFTFLYKGLNLTLVSKYGNVNEKREKQFLSFIANQIIRSDNPKNGVEESSNLYFERNRNKGILNYMIKTLEQGFIDIAGLSNKNVEKDKSSRKDKTAEKKKK
jgi:hypothetical protein